MNIENGIEILTVETNHLFYSIVPACGGKITSIFNKKLQKEFLWTNQALPLQAQEPGADYDSNFLGGIDELLPSDMPETVDGLAYPDHGELWTTPLKYELSGDDITLTGLLPQCGLQYSKTISPDVENPSIYTDYRVHNTTGTARSFLWKLHAALRIERDDRLVTPAVYAKVVDPAWSRFTNTDPFVWPMIEGRDASLVPPLEKSVDFFYLYNTPEGVMRLVSGGGKHVFCYEYDTKVFPYQWYFASYGGFGDHYTAILEPCTNMPMNIAEARSQGQCAVLKSGEKIETRVKIYAGEIKRPFVR